VTANKFTPLNNLQENNAESNELRTLHEQRKQTKQISTQNMNTTQERNEDTDNNKWEVYMWR
jgi:hypothetical protein